MLLLTRCRKVICSYNIVEIVVINHVFTNAYTSTFVDNRSQYLRMDHFQIPCLFVANFLLARCLLLLWTTSEKESTVPFIVSFPDSMQRRRSRKTAYASRIYNRCEKALLRDRIQNIRTNLAEVDSKLVNIFYIVSSSYQITDLDKIDII